MYLGIFLMLSVCCVIHKFPYFDNIFYQISTIDRDITKILQNKQKIRNVKRNQIHFEMICVILLAIALITCVVVDDFTYPP